MDVLLLAFAYHRDPRQSKNAAFLAKVQEANPATTLYNMMEVLGQLSFNVSAIRFAEWESWLIEPYHLTIIWPSATTPNAEAFFRSEIFEHPFAKMGNHRMAFLDALIIGLAERTPNIESFVTWNARHFKDKSFLRVLTPNEYLAEM